MEVKDDVLIIPEETTEIEEFMLQKYNLSNPIDMLSLNDEPPRKIKKIVIPSTVQKISKLAFAGLEGLEEVEFSAESKVKEIGANAFKDCKSLKKIKLPESLEEIYADAFRGCSQLECLIFPSKSTVAVASNSFEGCNKLEELHFLGRMQKCKGTNEDKNGIQIISNITNEITSWDEHIMELIPRQIKRFTLPGGIEKIKERAFSGRKGFTHINISQGVRHIEMFAFEYCTALEEINLPDGLEVLEHDTFSACEKLKNVHIGEGIPEIKLRSF